MPAPLTLMQTVVLALCSKLPGSFARIGVDWNAPDKWVLLNTGKRESILQGLAIAFTGITHYAFKKILEPGLTRSSTWSPRIWLLQGLATLGGVALSEVVSRKIAPSPIWQTSGADRFERQGDEDDDDDKQARPQVMPWPPVITLAHNPAPVQKTPHQVFMEAFGNRSPRPQVTRPVQPSLPNLAFQGKFSI